MKTFRYCIFIKILLFSIFSISSYAQTECNDREYLFKYCNGLIKCANHPRNEHKDIGPPITWNLGATIAWCSGLGNNGCFVDGTSINACISNAFATWISFCPSANFTIVRDVTGSQPCCIKILYSSNPNDFSNATIDFAVTYNRYYCPSGIMTCSPDFKILVNNTGMQGNTFQQCYPCPPPPNCDLHGAKPSNLCATLAHEIGHLLGLYHTATDDGYPCKGNSSDNSDLMYPSASANCREPHWSVNDQCMFIKLYCDGNGVLEVRSTSKAQIDNFFNVYPNPATNNLKIQFESSKFGLTTVSIVDLLGNTLREFTLSHADGFIERDLNIVGIPVGSYFVRVVNPDIHYTKSIRVY